MHQDHALLAHTVLSQEPYHRTARIRPAGRSTFIERFEQGFELGPGLAQKALGSILEMVYRIAHNDDAHHAHRHAGLQPITIARHVKIT